MTRLKKLALVPVLLVAGCGGTSVGVAVAALGIAGVALETYCATGGAGCSPAMITYGDLIIAEASRDAVILESGQATAAQINMIVANLQTYLTGANLPGLTPAQQQEISAITTAISVLLPLVEAIMPKPPAPPTQTVSLPRLTARDNAQLAKFKVKRTALAPHKP
jgi:hypothetical protein